MTGGIKLVPSPSDIIIDIEANENSSYQTHSLKANITPKGAKVSPSALDISKDIEESLDEVKEYRYSQKTTVSENDFLSERVDLLLNDSKKFLTYNIFLQFTSSKFQLSHIYKEYNYFRHSTIIWQCEYLFGLLALLYYLVVGNIQEMFFHRINYIFLLSFISVCIATISAILSRFGDRISPLFLVEEVKWVKWCLGIQFSRVQLYELYVFFFSVLSSNLILLARVVAGACPSQNRLQPFKLWYLQDCNPMAEVSTITVLINS